MEISLSIVVVACCAGLLGLSLKKAGFVDSCALEGFFKERGAGLRSTFLFYLAYSFFFQGLSGIYFQSSSYAGVAHILGGALFGVGAAMVGSCPLWIFTKSAHGGRFVWFGGGLAGLILGVYVGRALYSSFDQQQVVLSVPFYLDEVLGGGARYFMLGLGFLCLSGILFSSWSFSLRELVLGLGFFLPVLVSQNYNFGVGTIAGLSAFMDIRVGMSYSQIYQIVFLLVLVLVLAMGRATTPCGSRKSQQKIPIAAFIMGCGGSIAGGCTLGALIEGTSTLSIGALLTNISIMVSFLISRKAMNGWRGGR